LLYFFTGKAVNSALTPSSASSETTLLQNSFGKYGAGTLTIASCLPLLIIAATALLVTSGYTFNEVFLYWFPNFGFAFLLLALLTLLQFLPVKQIHRVQLFFVSLAGMGILILGIYGTISPDKSMGFIFRMPEQFSASGLSSALLLLFFAGSNLLRGKEKGRPYLLGIALLVFLPWMFASLAHVNPERLAISTIPFMTASRTIMGDAGRQIMGVVVIAGSCAAFTGFTLLCRQKIEELSQNMMAPSFLAAGGQRWLLPPLIAVVAGACMATGLAGDELLEILLRSTLLLWLLCYCFVGVAAVFSKKSAGAANSSVSGIAVFLLIAGFLTILFGDPHTMELLKYITLLLLASFSLATLLIFIHPKRKDIP
ncbi:MAG: hypothetical protein DSY80_05285, partial [Desulfocapsa sp.]